MLRVSGKQNSLFPDRSVIKCFVIPPSSKIETKTAKKLVRLTPAGTEICRGFKGHELITCESKVQVVVSLGS